MPKVSGATSTHVGKVTALVWSDIYFIDLNYLRFSKVRLLTSPPLG